MQNAVYSSDMKNTKEKPFGLRTFKAGKFEHLIRNFSFEAFSISNTQIRYVIKSEDKIISYRFFLELIGQSTVFQTFFITVLANCPFKGFKLETKAINNVLVDKQFEFILIHKSNLENIQPDTSTFIEQWKKYVFFENI